MINADKFKKITQRIDSYREAMIELQTALSAVPAIGPENGGDRDGGFFQDRDRQRV